MTGPILGLVTIGQAPRVDVHIDIAPVLHGHEWVEHGALDDLGADDLHLIAPETGEVPLVSRMRDGSRATIGHRALLPRLADAVERCATDGAAAVLVMCTGHVERFESRIPVYAAEPLAQESILRELAGARFGVINPLADQTSDASARWALSAGHAVVTTHADPYTASIDEIVAAGVALASDESAPITAIVLDCFGYSAEMGAAITAATGLPVHVVRVAATLEALRRISS